MALQHLSLETNTLNNIDQIQPRYPPLNRSAIPAMFGFGDEDKEAGHHLLGHDDSALATDETARGTAWDNVQSAGSGRTTPNHSEIWEQDPLHDGSHELHDISKASRSDSTTRSSQKDTRRPRRQRPPPEDLAGAATELEGEFERIFTPMKKAQEDRTRFHNELDAACEAYAARLEEMREEHRALERAIERPWLLARRRRQWERFAAVVRRFNTVATCFYGGTVGHLDEVPPQVPWPPPHLTRMKEHHADAARALHEAHRAVVDDLRTKHQCELDDEGRPRSKHVCVNRSLLLDEGRGGGCGEDGPVPTDDDAE